MIKVVDVFNISGTDKTLVTLSGDISSDVGKGRFIQRDAAQIEIDSLPMMAGETKIKPNELTVGVIDNILQIGDIVAIV